LGCHGYKKDRSLQINPTSLVKVSLVLCCAAGLWFATLLAGCAAGPRNAPVTDVRAGQPGTTEFESYCAACHQYDGQGMGEAPPLEGSPWVVGPQNRLIKIVLHGVRGKTEIAGKTYDREMPGFGQILSDEEIASLLSFVRGRFGNLRTPVEARTVSQIRAEHEDRTGYWSIDELLSDP